MKENLEYYLEKGGADSEALINFEAKVNTPCPSLGTTIKVNIFFQPFVYKFLEGSKAYDNKQWLDVIKIMEESIHLYLAAEEKCRFECEKPFDMGWFPDFVSSVASESMSLESLQQAKSIMSLLADHFTFCLRCKLQCAKDLSNLNGQYVDNVYPMMYHYLQFAYFQSELDLLFWHPVISKA